MEHIINIIDDDADVLSSLSWMLEGDGYIVRSFLSVASFLQETDIKEKGIIIADVQMPGMTGIDLQKLLIKEKSPFALIIVSAHGSINMAVKAIKHGAIDFLEKPIDVKILKKLINRAKSYTEDLYRKKQVHERLETLTPAEIKIMEKVLSGKLNKIIAAELNVSQRTVEIHRNKILSKMNVQNSTELAFLISDSIT